MVSLVEPLNDNVLNKIFCLLPIASCLMPIRGSPDSDPFAANVIIAVARKLQRPKSGVNAHSAFCLVLFRALL
jgi:hypothetical protein